MSEAAPLGPQELDRLEAMDPALRAAWMLDEVARHEEVWGLMDANGWVLFKLDQAPEGRSPYALPLWPRQELAAMGARDSNDQPQRVDLETLLEEVLPQVAQEGWRILPCPGANGAAVVEVEAWSVQLSDAWTALAEEDV